MKKLRLELDQLSVESFTIPATGEAPGTVRANAELAAGTEGAAGVEVGAGTEVAVAGTTDILSFLLFGTCNYSCNCTLGNTCPNSCANTLCNNRLCQEQTTTYAHMIVDDTINVND
jgi:hypothetical protein